MRRRELVVAVTAAVLVAVVDAVLLQRKASFFTGGFLSEHHLDSFGASALFVLLCVASNLALTFPLAMLGAAGALRWRVSSAAAALLAFLTALAPLLFATFIAYQLWMYIGDADLGMLFQLTGRHLSEFL